MGSSVSSSDDGGNSCRAGSGDGVGNSRSLEDGRGGGVSSIKAERDCIAAMSIREGEPSCSETGAVSSVVGGENTRGNALEDRFKSIL